MEAERVVLHENLRAVTKCQHLTTVLHAPPSEISSQGEARRRRRADLRRDERADGADAPVVELIAVCAHEVGQHAHHEGDHGSGEPGEVEDVVVVEVEWGRWSEEEEMSEMSVRDAQRGLCAVNRGASARADHVLLCC